MTTYATDDVAAACSDEHKGTQADIYDQPLYQESDRSSSREAFKAKVAEQEARIKAVFPGSFTVRMTPIDIVKHVLALIPADLGCSLFRHG